MAALTPANTGLDAATLGAHSRTIRALLLEADSLSEAAREVAFEAETGPAARAAGIAFQDAAEARYKAARALRVLAAIISDKTEAATLVRVAREHAEIAQSEHECVYACMNMAEIFEGRG